MLDLDKLLDIVVFTLLTTSMCGVVYLFVSFSIPLFDICPLNVGDKVSGGGIVKHVESDIKSPGSCEVHVRFPGDKWVNDYAFKFEKIN